MPNQERQTSSELQVHDRQDSADTTRDQISDQDTNLAGEGPNDGIIVAPNNENPIGVMKSPSESRGSLKVENIEIDRLHPNPRQPRKRQREEALSALASSLADEGFLQPILVRPHPTVEGQYEIVAGERRWRAAKLSGFHQVPALIRDFSNGSSLEASLIENMQRQDLNPIEVAEGYRCLLEEFGHTHETIARLFGKSRSHVVNTKRLLNLPSAVKELVEDGDLTAGHARALLNADQPEELAKHVVAKGLSVRRTEQLAQPIHLGEPTRFKSKSANPTKIVSEPSLTALLGLRVTISHRSGGCVLNIHCDDPENLNDLVERLRDWLLGISESKRVENGGGDPIDNKTPVQEKFRVTRKITREEIKKLAAQYGYSYP